VILAAVFATAGVAKLRDRQGTQDSLQEFGVPKSVVSPFAVALPLAELATAVALVPRPSAQWGGLAALVLLLAFIAGITRALARGEAPDCNCFGQIHSEPAGRGTVVRNIVLAAVATLVVVEGPGPSVTGWIADRSAAELVAVGAGAAALAAAIWALTLWRENRALKVDLADARERLSLLPPGLPVGSVAPPFELRSAGGGTVSLEALRARGLPVVLVFLTPGCPQCDVLMPQLGGWQKNLSDSVTVAVLSRGTEEENQGAIDSGAQVLLQQAREVKEVYRLSGSPIAQLVSPDGRIASQAVAGMSEIESLIRLTMRGRNASTVELASAQPG
jgi:thiol-disulfide isomerase/thioredoxin